MKRFPCLLLLAALAATMLSVAIAVETHPSTLVKQRSVAGMTAAQRAVSSTPGYRDFVTDLTLSGEVLLWTYRNTGDYNLDGLVGVSDLTPIGQHYEAREGDANWAQAKHADGNGDGMVTVSDITQIGQNFGNLVVGYEVWGGNSVGGEWSFMGEAPMEFLRDDAARPYFRVGVSGFSAYRVWPYDGSDDEGWWSNYAFEGSNPQLQMVRVDPIW